MSFKTSSSDWRKGNWKTAPATFFGISNLATLASNGKQYLRKVKALIGESEELRSILDSQNLEAIRRSAKEQAGIAPNFDLHLNLDALRQTLTNTS